MAVESRSILEDFLPEDASVTGLLPKLDVRDLSRLARTCRGINHLFKDHLHRELINHASHYVIVEPDKCNIKKVIDMMIASPALLQAKVPQVKDSAGRIFKNRTLYQLAAGAEDYDLCLAMKNVFIMHYGSERAAINEIEKQGEEHFEVDCWRKDAEDKARLQLILQPVIAVVNAEQFNLGSDDNKLILRPATLAAIEAFRDELKKWLLHHENGIHFRYRTLLEAYFTYVEIAASWNYEYNKCALFEDGVLSSIQSYLPEHFAQKFSQGVHSLESSNEPSRRSLVLQSSDKKFYDAVRGASSDFVLSGSCVDIMYGTAAASHMRCLGQYALKFRAEAYYRLFRGNLLKASILNETAVEVSAFNLIFN